APRCADRQAMLVHRQHDAAPLLAALEQVGDVAIAQPDGLRLGHGSDGEQVAYERAFPSLATSFSIQSSTFPLSSSACMPDVSIAAPMLTVIVPGYLMKALRPQTVPALCAIGSAGAPVLHASHAPPGW